MNIIQFQFIFVSYRLRVIWPQCSFEMWKTFKFFDKELLKDPQTNKPYDDLEVRGTRMLQFPKHAK